jgi:hypothetical protein
MQTEACCCFPKEGVLLPTLMDICLAGVVHAGGQIVSCYQPVIGNYMQQAWMWAPERSRRSTSATSMCANDEGTVLRGAVILTVRQVQVFWADGQVVSERQDLFHCTDHGLARSKAFETVCGSRGGMRSWACTLKGIMP